MLSSGPAHPQVLDIDPQWRMHQVSDGQRRRVQICVGLLKPFKVSWCITLSTLVFWHTAAPVTGP